MSKRPGGIIDCKDKTSLWSLNGFPGGSNIESTVLKRIRLQIADRSVDRCQDRMLGWVSILFAFCGVRVRDASITIGKLHLMIRFVFVLNSTSTNPTLLHVKPVNAAASRASSLRLSLIITLAESVSFKHGELTVS